MGYVIEPTGSTQRAIRRVARARLDDAIAHLDSIVAAEPGLDIESSIHRVRKRCKETRSLARLVCSALGDDFKPFDRLVRDAANELSAARDAQAVLVTFDRVLATQPASVAEGLRSVRHEQAARSAAAVAALHDQRGRVHVARDLLVQARDRSQAWKVPSGFAPIGGGLEASYDLGRRLMHRAEHQPTDERVHAWRKAVKHLWYHTRLLHDAAPSVLAPLADHLARLADALGDDHDLAVLVELLDAQPQRFGTAQVVADARLLAINQQVELRVKAFRAGATIYSEPPDVFRNRIRGYWRVASAAGPERPVSGIVVPRNRERRTTAHGAPGNSASSVERERRFLIDSVPDGLDLSDTIEIRQGYLVADWSASVRVRDAGSRGCTLTVKVGSGAERTELEWPLERDQFDAVWPHTEPRRVLKTRYPIPVDGHLVELDMFAGALHGLVLAEVEFDSAEALAAYVPPPWFGREVTDDGRYTNASLALRGHPDPEQLADD